MSSPPDVDALERRLHKRGFKRTDGYMFECAACGNNSMLTYGIMGKSGGRTIRLCVHCGATKSWLSGAGMGSASEDPDFDLERFLA
jgi:hypothetical protein